MALRQAKYQFYNNDNAESTSTALAAINTSITRVDGDESTFLIRFLIQSDASTAGTNTAAQFTRNINGGAFSNITTSSTIIKAVTTSVFADAANTTARLGGTGTFESSSQGCTHDGLAGGAQMDIVANGNAETVCAVQMVAADVAPGDVIEIRLSTSPTAITAFDQLATITVTAPPPAITSIDTDNDTVDTRVSVPIVGTNFGSAGTGSFKVEVSNNATYGSGTVVQLTATYNSSTSITVTMRRSSDNAALATLFTLPLSPAYLWVTESGGTRNSTGFQFTLRAPGPTPAAALNTNASLNVDTTYLLRVRVENSGGAGGTDFKWQANHNAAGYADVTTVSSNVRAVAAATFVNDDDVIEVLGGTGSYLVDNNAGTEDGTTTLGAAFPGSGAVEFVLAFQLRGVDVSNGETGQIRLVQGDGTAFGAYTNTLTYTVVEAAAGAGMTFMPPLRRFQHMLVR